MKKIIASDAKRFASTDKPKGILKVMFKVHELILLTCISRKPKALPIVVAVKSLPPLPKVVTAQDFQP